MTYDTQTPYAASYLIFKKDSKVAFLLRSNTSWMNNYYSLPSGKVEVGESFLQAAVRETKEEVGVDLRAEQLRPVLTCHRREMDGGNDGMVWVDVMFEVLEWKGELINAEPHMHGELAWLDLDNLPDNIIPSLRIMLEAYQAGQSYCEQGWE